MLQSVKSFRLVLLLLSVCILPSVVQQRVIGETDQTSNTQATSVTREQIASASHRENQTGKTTDRPSGYKAGDTWTNSIGMTFAHIPSGKFMMGDSLDDPHLSEVEREPYRLVRITEPFLMLTTEVTQAQWNRVMRSNPSRFRSSNRPVERVTWYDAVEFCRKLSEKDGREYRLPTEAEWEYACRAGTQTPFYTGNTATTEQANYSDDGRKAGGYYGSPADRVGRKGVRSKKTVPVASFPANPWGLYDMHGNVSEWCSDEFVTPETGDPELDAVANKMRVTRSGSWASDLPYVRSAYRGGWGDDQRSMGVGFRVICSAIPSPELP